MHCKLHWNSMHWNNLLWNRRWKTTQERAAFVMKRIQKIFLPEGIFLFIIFLNAGFSRYNLSANTSLQWMHIDIVGTHHRFRFCDIPLQVHLHLCSTKWTLTRQREVTDMVIRSIKCFQDPAMHQSQMMGLDSSCWEQVLGSRAIGLQEAKYWSPFSLSFSFSLFFSLFMFPLWLFKVVQFVWFFSFFVEDFHAGSLQRRFFLFFSPFISN